MSIKAVLFDLDGTLLPMDQDVFIGTYFKGLAGHLIPRGYDPERLIKVIWQGTEAMIKNDGSQTNESAFWQVFTAAYGADARQDEPYFEEFYRTKFPDIKRVCGYDERAAGIVKLLKDVGITVALATNPVFPAVATRERMAWAGLSSEDFALYTTYENSVCTKPNLKYYTEITDKLGVLPEECLMVGNDVDDDMVASELGMKVFLLTDCLINKNGLDVNAYPNGSFDQLKDYIIEQISAS